jgi:predicted Rossmann fold flavoprotein
MKKTETFDVVIVGGGASGLMSASVASSLGKKVLIIEKNKTLGNKLSITGGGRCNITNAEEDIHKFLSSYESSADFLYSPFSKFGNKDTFKYFESKGLPIVVEARKRAFPHTQKATDVVNFFKKEITKGKVDIRLSSQVSKIIKDKDNKRILSVETKDARYSAKSFIFATGGFSHPETGSTGDGFKWLSDLGHDVKDPTPTIVPLKTFEKWSHLLAGVSLSFMKITFYLEGKKQFSKTGKILFTHFGLSGPLILNTSGKVSDLLYSGEVKALIDAYPDTDLGALDKKITKIFDENKNKTLKNVLKYFVPDGTAKGISLLFSDILLDTKVHSIKKEERKKIVQTLKSLPVTIEGLMGYDRAVVADGGVVLKEIDMKTMRSKLYDNLFIIGDLLHISRPSGGYSLQLCWTTGFIAGQNA